MYENPVLIHIFQDKKRALTTIKLLAKREKFSKNNHVIYPCYTNKWGDCYYVEERELDV